MTPTKDDIDFLAHLDFHLEKDGKTFYSDKWSKGGSYAQIYFDEAYDKWCIYHYDADDENEDYNHYDYVDKLDDVTDYL